MSTGLTAEQVEELRSWMALEFADWPQAISKLQIKIHELTKPKPREIFWVVDDGFAHYGTCETREQAEKVLQEKSVHWGELRIVHFREVIE